MQVRHPGQAAARRGAAMPCRDSRRAAFHGHSRNRYRSSAMQELTQTARQRVDDIAARNGVSQDAVATLLRAVSNGGGGMAQFSHPELGGMGQWSQGGMIMVGDMFNNGLKYRVDSLCNELANLLREMNPFVPPPPMQGGGFNAGLRRRLRPMVAGRARQPGLLRRAERHALRLFPWGAPAGGAAERPDPGLRHRAPHHLRRLPAAGRRPVAELRLRLRHGAGGGPAAGRRPAGRNPSRRPRRRSNRPGSPSR